MRRAQHRVQTDQGIGRQREDFKMHLLRLNHRHRPSFTWAQRYLQASAFHPSSQLKQTNYWGETDPFCLKLRLKDSSSQGCLLSLIRTSGLPVSSTPNPQTSLVSNSAPSSPHGDKEQRLKGSPWTDVTPRASAQGKAHRRADPAGFEKSFWVYPAAQWPPDRQFQPSPSSWTSHGWPWGLNAAC